MSQQRAKADTEGTGASVRPEALSPLAIIAGNGSLPFAVAEAALAEGRAICIIGIRGEADEAIERFPHAWVKWGEVGKLFSTLEAHGAHDLVIIGSVTRPDLANVSFDLGAIRNLPRLLRLGVGGDDNVLSTLVRFFEDKGYRVRGAGEVAPGIVVREGRLGAKDPSADDKADIDIGFRVVEALGRLDIGQAAVVAKRHVLAVEAAEGTDAMLGRCAALRRYPARRARHRAGVLVKAPKPGQEERIDLPAIGPDTVKKAAEAGLSGIAVAAGQVLIAERTATIAAADENGLFLFGQTLAARSDA
jgi:DUF1009 family protein